MHQKAGFKNIFSLRCKEAELFSLSVQYYMFKRCISLLKEWLWGVIITRFLEVRGISVQNIAVLTVTMGDNPFLPC